jgi:hypothetical protein
MPGMLVPVSQKCSAFWSFHAQQCLGFTEDGATNKKHPVSGSPVGENSLFMRVVKVEWQESSKLIDGPQTDK